MEYALSFFTPGLDITTRHSMSSDGQKIIYHIHDTAGQEKFKSMLPAFIRNCDAIAVVYDVGCRVSEWGYMYTLDSIESVVQQLHIWNVLFPGSDLKDSESG